jgi:hypothetical protein
MILVTGAMGAVGGRVARLLTERVERLRLLVRDPSGAPKLAGVEVAVGDDSDAACLVRPSLASGRRSSSRAMAGRASDGGSRMEQLVARASSHVANSTGKRHSAILRRRERCASVWSTAVCRTNDARSESFPPEAKSP